MNKKKLYESIMNNVAIEVKKTLNEDFDSDKSYRQELAALHDTIEILVDNDMETTVETLFGIISRFGEADLIVRKFKQYAKEFNIML